MDEDWNRRNQDLFGDGPRRDGLGHFFHGGFGDAFFQPFRDMMNSFFADIPPEFNHPFEAIEPARPEGHEFLNPRDRMLKRADPFEEPFHHDRQWYDNVFVAPHLPPNFHPSENEDQDLDDRISSESLGSMMTPQTSFFKSFSSRTIRTADGKVEEERTIRDSSGKEERIVKRILGDQSHTVTTKRHTDGAEEIIEDMVNMDEHSLSDFNKNWSGTRSMTQDIVPMQVDPHQPLLNSSGFMDVFKKFFGYNRRDE